MHVLLVCLCLCLRTVRYCSSSKYYVEIYIRQFRLVRGPVQLLKFIWSTFVTMAILFPELLCGLLEHVRLHHGGRVDRGRHKDLLGQLPKALQGRQVKRNCLHNGFCNGFFNGWPSSQG